MAEAALAKRENNFSATVLFFFQILFKSKLDRVIWQAKVCNELD